MFKEFFGKVRAMFSGSGMIHPKVTFAAAVSGIAALSDSPDDFNSLFGKEVGARVYVLSKWFGKFCIAFAAAGHSVFTQNQNIAAAEGKPDA